MDASFKTNFYAGRPHEVVTRALIGPEASFGPNDAPYVIASLAAVGQIGEAEVLLRNQTATMSPDAQVFAHVHVATASVAFGRYPTARRHLGRAAILRNATMDGASNFYLYYGLAQYRFATGRLKLATMEGHRAGAFLRRTDQDYASALWYELIGHLKVLTGDPRGGLAHFDAALKHATSLGRQEQIRSLTTSRVLYEARYARKPKDSVALLRSHIAARPLEDTFARASLLLELCRQELLRKRVADASAAFDLAVLASYGTQSRRYQATASMRLVDLLLANGAQTEALVTLQAMEKMLDDEADDLLALELSSRRLAVLSKLLETKSMPASLVAARKEELRRCAALERRTGFVRPNEPKAKAKASDPGLNHRQVKLLAELADRQSIDVQAYRRKYDVSEITACRDLASLSRAGHLVRLGKARATRYVKPPQAT